MTNKRIGQKPILLTLSKYIYNNFSIDYEYDHNDNIIDCIVSLDNEVFQNINYEYNKDDSIIKVTVDNNIVNYNYDYLGRLVNKNINSNLNIEYNYITNGNKTSLELESMKIDNDLYKYKYDELGNIIEVYLNNNLMNSYTYDKLNQLVEEKDYIHNKQHIYVYDKEGNIKTKKEINLETNELLKTDTYEYTNQSWEDQLTRFNNETITYDEIGNPLTIGNKTLTWKQGRQLASYTDNDLNVTYDYDIDGIRKSKTVNGVKTEYNTVGSNILIEKRNNDMIYYIYDTDDVIGLKHNNNIYYYKKNHLGDVIGIYDSNYNQIVSYEYDSWGKVLSVKDNNGNEITDTSNIGLINPYRYRSYYYDEETKLYYLNSRYYNPEWGRFINVDGIMGANEDFLSYNLYNYCSNSLVINLDSNGSKKKSILKNANKLTINQSLSEFYKSSPLNSVFMFIRSFLTGKKKSFSPISNLANSFINSPHMNNIINDKISKYKDSGQKVFYGYDDFYGKSNIVDLDLRYSVGRFEYKIEIMEIKKIKKRNYYTIDVNITDNYDFHLWDSNKEDSFINNFGYNLQEKEIIKKYKWDLNYKVIIEG